MTETTASWQARLSRPSTLLPLLAAALLLLTALIYYALPVNQPCPESILIGPRPAGVDWHCALRPATVDFLRGGDPYAHDVYNPPWAFMLLAPFALLPPGWDYAFLMIVGLAVFAYAAARLHHRPLVVALFLLSPFVLGNMLLGNFDWLVALGFTLPPPVGIFLLMTKPQIGLAVAVFWGVEALRARDPRRLALLVLPVTAAFLLSWAIYGPFFLRGPLLLDSPANTSLWPAVAPVGAALLARAIHKRELRLAIIAGPFLAPYVAGQSWAIAMLGLNGWEMLAAIAAFYAVRLLALL